MSNRVRPVTLTLWAPWGHIVSKATTLIAIFLQRSTQISIQELANLFNRDANKPNTKKIKEIGRSMKLLRNN